MNFKRLYKNCISCFFYFYTRLAECDLDDIYCTRTDNINFGVLNSGKVCPRDFNIFTSVFQFSGHLLQLFFNSYIFVWKQQGNYYQSWFEAPVEYEELKLYNYDHKEFVPHGLGQIWKFHFFCTVMKRSKRKVVLSMKPST